MAELPEIYLLAQQMKKELVGKTGLALRISHALLASAVRMAPASPGDLCEIPP